MFSMFGWCKYGAGCEMVHVDTRFREKNNVDEGEGEPAFDDVIMRFHEAAEGHRELDHGSVTRAFAVDGGVFWVAQGCGLR